MKRRLRKQQDLLEELEALSPTQRARRLAAIQGRLVDTEQEEDDLDDAARDQLVDEYTAALELEQLRAEIAALKDLVEQARRVREQANDSKLAALKKCLGEAQFLELKDGRGKLLLFTEHRDTLTYVREHLEKWGYSTCEIHGGMNPHERKRAQELFRTSAQVCVATEAAGEGINLQFARVLFNYDLPWNPMDLEQRIGRIHRYGQRHTAQVYNLVATDTIEGQIFLLLEEKLHGIAQTLGKVDEHGQVAEDLRAQVLGQLSSRLSYNRLYQEAILDPSPKRTRQELEVAMTNANLAREVVFELFQDLDKFNLGDYKRFDDEGRGMRRLVAFVQRAARLDGGEFRPRGKDVFELVLPAGASPHADMPGQDTLLFTTDRDKALQQEDLNLLGLEHPVVKQWLDRYTSLNPEERALIGNIEGNGDETGLPVRDTQTGLITIWQVVVHGKGGQVQQRIVRLDISPTGERSPYLERLSKDLLKACPCRKGVSRERDTVSRLVNGTASELLHRELVYSGFLPEGASYSSKLLACLEVAP